MRQSRPAACCHEDFGLDAVLGPDLLFPGHQEAVNATSKGCQCYARVLVGPMMSPRLDGCACWDEL